MRSRLIKLFNWFLVAMQAVATCALISLGLSRGYYLELSASLTGSSTPPFNSLLLNILMSKGAAYAWVLLLAVIVAKEFLLRPLAVRLKVNVALLLALLVIAGFTFPAIYSPL